MYVLHQSISHWHSLPRWLHGSHVPAFIIASNWRPFEKIEKNWIFRMLQQGIIQLHNFGWNIPSCSSSVIGSCNCVKGKKGKTAVSCFHRKRHWALTPLYLIRIAMRLFMTDAATVADNMIMMTMSRKTMITTMTMAMMMMSSWGGFVLESAHESRRLRSLSRHTRENGSATSKTIIIIIIIIMSMMTMVIVLMMIMMMMIIKMTQSSLVLVRN